jgi:DNA-binding GntR family transcriptional regulator
MRDDQDPDLETRSAIAAKAPSDRTSRAQHVYDALRSMIQEGRYGSGDRIREEEVARTLGVSRTPVREALSRLQARGLLEMAQGGLVVAVLKRAQVLELYAMREILEGSAARFAAQHASPSEIGTLHRLAEHFERSLGDPRKLALINREFHEAIHEAAHNRYLMRTLYELNDALALLPGTTFMVEGRPRIAVEEHARIIQAVEQRDADAAERAARHHMHKAQEARLELMLQFG